ncbi:lumazine-binding protein [Mycobacterium sp. SMC-4]|uniref:Rv0361 family membrane protein n=1 Tax=Mycobacterium sp. SMC-4 TaxID=2857059 RepID=UPI0021B46243|nr:lumazine-binding protein [Mycobacterium sp. SMC-4]UXA18535.1 lumazine-binding protein [Mycobacterium sp. SMC-4]
MSESDGSDKSGPSDESTGSSAGPFLGALTIIVAVVIAIWLFNVFSGDELTDEQQIARAAAGQNDALQRSDYAAFQSYSCLAQHRTESEILDRQRDSEQQRGNRVVERLNSIAIDGDRATAEVTYYFLDDRDTKETVPITFLREGGGWKVCSLGPS